MEIEVEAGEFAVDPGVFSYEPEGVEVSRIERRGDLERVPVRQSPGRLHSWFRQSIVAGFSGSFAES
jgi:hypothetical protein